MKKSQFGGVSVIVIVLVFLALLMFSLVGGFITSRDAAVNKEAKIEARYKDNENIVSSCVTTLSTISKVPGMYMKDFTEAVREDMSGRYGTGERVALFIKERNLPFSDEMYKKIMNTAIDCETRLEAGQRSLMDMKASYEAALGSTVQGGFMSLAGFPKKDMSQFKNVIHQDAREQFETGVRKSYDLGETK